LIDECLEVFKEKTKAKKIVICMLKFIIKSILKKKIKSGDKEFINHTSSMRYLDTEEKNRLKEKIERFIFEYIICRYNSLDKAPTRSQEKIPIPFTFVFGHTHDYWEDTITKNGNTFPIINSGGWTVDKNGNRRDSGILVIDPNGPKWMKY